MHQTPMLIKYSTKPLGLVEEISNVEFDVSNDSQVEFVGCDDVGDSKSIKLKGYIHWGDQAE